MKEKREIDKRNKKKRILKLFIVLRVKDFDITIHIALGLKLPGAKPLYDSEQNHDDSPLNKHSILPLKYLRPTPYLIIYHSADPKANCGKRVTLASREC